MHANLPSPSGGRLETCPLRARADGLGARVDGSGRRARRRQGRREHARCWSIVAPSGVGTVVRPGMWQVIRPVTSGPALVNSTQFGHRLVDFDKIDT